MAYLIRRRVPAVTRATKPYLSLRDGVKLLLEAAADVLHLRLHRRHRRVDGGEVRQHRRGEHCEGGGGDGGRVSTHLGFRERGFREERRTAAGEDEVLKLRDAGLEGGGHGVQRRGRRVPVAGVHGKAWEAARAGEERFGGLWAGTEGEAGCC